MSKKLIIKHARNTFPQTNWKCNILFNNEAKGIKEMMQDVKK